MICLIGLCLIVSGTYGASCQSSKCDVQNNMVPDMDDLEPSFFKKSDIDEIECCQLCIDDADCAWFEFHGGFCFLSYQQITKPLRSEDGKLYGTPKIASK